MSDQQNCHCCLSRRQCVKMLSLGALGAGMMAPALQIIASDKSSGANAEFIDPAKLRPQPETRIAAVIL
ncbi:MAG: hypothetical protein NTX50_28675, partial [Candidatus Sumerlaeota bacterium]|nr:hypothetical protein [Candidatus Sumerlaeota bacterium]